MISVFTIKFLKPVTSQGSETHWNRAYPIWTPGLCWMLFTLFIHSADFGVFMPVLKTQSYLYCSSAVYFDLIYNNYYSSGPS